MKYDYEVEYDSRNPLILKYSLIRHDSVLDMSIAIFSDKVIGTSHHNFRVMLRRIEFAIKDVEKRAYKWSIRQKPLESITIFNEGIEIAKKYV